MIYGLDLSMTKTGIAILNWDKEILHTELIKPKAKLSHGKKLRYYRDRFRELESEYKPALVGIEGGFSKFINSTQVVYRVHGVAEEFYSDYDVLSFKPTQVKKYFTGKGNASKEEMILQAERIYGNIYEEDVADAIAVARLAIHNKLVKEAFERGFKANEEALKELAKID